jgi:DNA-binding NarL/FixJ family response regulator
MSDLVLSRDDGRNLARTLETLLAPLGQESFDEWRLIVQRCMRELFAGDMATSQVPQDAKPLLSAEVDVAILSRYPEHLKQLDEQLHFHARMLRQGAWTRERLWGRDLPLLYVSAYWNELLVPARAYNAMGVTVKVDGESAPMTLYLNRDQRHGSFTDRDAAIMRLLLPAVRVGLNTRVRLGRVGPLLGALFDNVEHGMQLVDFAGGISHRNAALRRLLASDPQGEVLEDEMLHLAADVRAYAGSGSELPELLYSGPCSSTVRTAMARYRLSACTVADLLPNAGVVLIVQRLGAAVPDSDSLRIRFGFTPRQAEIAILLAERLSNAEIALRLAIRPATARHHTERVLAGLGVHSRNDVQAALIADKETQS